MIGGYPSNPDPEWVPTQRKVEFWSPADPEEGSCELEDYPRGMKYGPTANLVSGQLVACFNNQFLIFNI